jgi:hypothetical protein
MQAKLSGHTPPAEQPRRPIVGERRRSRDSTAAWVALALGIAGGVAFLAVGGSFVPAGHGHAIQDWIFLNGWKVYPLVAGFLLSAYGLLRRWRAATFAWTLPTTICIGYAIELALAFYAFASDPS